MQSSTNGGIKIPPADNPAYQAARDILGALIPVAGLSGAATKVISATKTPRLYKALGIFGADLGIDAAYIGVSDQGKDDLFRVLDDAFPWLSFPEDIKTLDDDMSVHVESRTFMPVVLWLLSATSLAQLVN